MTPVCTVLVLGDPMRGDDGAALLATKHLETCAIPRLPGLVRRPAGPDDLVAALTEGPCLVLDAVRGVPPAKSWNGRSHAWPRRAVRNRRPPTPCRPG